MTGVQTCALPIYVNLGSGYPIYSSSNGITALYNTLTADSDHITGFLSADTIFLSAFADPDSSTSGGGGSTTGLVPISVQGGRFQYTNTISASAIPTSGYVIADAVQDDLLAKTFIKCTVPFDQNSSLYSIGVSAADWENPLLITEQFTAPSAEGLVPFSYSNSMSSEYYWLTGDSELRIYRYGTQCTNGKIGISTFYDNVHWTPNYGYVMGGDNNIQRFNMDFDYLDCSDRGSQQLNTDNLYYSSISHNSYIYTAGGYSSVSITNAITRFETKNDTVNVIDRGDIVNPRHSMSIGKSLIKCYFIGGYDGTNAVTTTDNIQFSNDSANSISNANLNTGRWTSYTTYSTTNIYCGGGGNGTPSYLDSIEKMSFISDNTFSTLATVTLSIPRHRIWGFNTSLYGYYGSGSDATSLHNVLDKFIFSTETMSTKNNYQIIPVVFSPTVQNTRNGYHLDGISGVTVSTSPQVRVIQKYNFDTETGSVVESSTATSASRMDAASV